MTRATRSFVANVFGAMRSIVDDTRHASILAVMLSALLLAGCASRGPASIAGGECRIFERPPYEVRGKKPYDQDWIDSQVEGGVGGCQWKRPAPRPAELDAPASKAQASPARRKSLIRRIRDRVRPPAQPAIPAAAEPVEPPPPAAAVSPPPPPRPPRSALERLLQPRDDD
jgi:hypothetical protein